ncbi:CU044_5270 family protein [Streptomyces sp. NPDC007157]|uniref:CU044_5270 family protein n=1 Tax=Streptomyces sp. NPDC007157 TaxID=3154681 RepID=UPI0033FCD82B
MDEMTEVRALRADAPVPDRARLAAGRALLTDAVRAGERRRAGWRREFVIVAVVAAVTAVAVTAALLVGGGGTGRRVQPATPDIDLKGLSARDFLERAADALDREPAGTEPTGKQWIYTHVVSTPGDETSERWARYDGELRARYETADGRRLTVEPARPGGEKLDVYDSPRAVYRFVATLPADGEGTLRALRAWNALSDDGLKGPGGQAWDDYMEISTLLRYRFMPPAGQASLYRALALLVKGDVANHLVGTVTGRKAVAVANYFVVEDPQLPPYRTGRLPSMVQQVLIDPRTYHVVGWRQFMAGKVVDSEELITMAVVDKAGERP